MSLRDWFRRSLARQEGNARFRDASQLGLRVEALEDRRLLAFNPSGLEQEVLELVNHFRADPSGSFEMLVGNPQVAGFLSNANTNLASARNQMAQLPSGGAPLAWNEAGLLQSADQHAISMKNANLLTQSTHAPTLTATANIRAPQPIEPITLHASLAIDSVPRGSTGDANRDGILDSLARREVLLDSRLDTVGIGVVTNRRGSQNEMWMSQQFGLDASANTSYLLGVIYTDANGDGRYNAGEGLGGVNVEIAGAGNVWSVSTSSSGAYQLELPPGTYHVQATGVPASGSIDMGTVALGAKNAKRDLATTAGAAPSRSTITGFVFQDADRNGQRATNETGFAGRIVFLDSNGNGHRDANEPAVTTSASGFYRLNNIPSGTASVRVVGTPNSRATTAVERTVSVVAGQITTAVNFGQIPRGGVVTPPPKSSGQITGFFFYDTDRDGVREAGEPALAGWTVYVDANNNSRWDRGERATRTSATGFYRLTQLSAGVNTVRALAKPGRYFTTNSTRYVEVQPNRGVAGQHFGASTRITRGSLSGFVYLDRNRDQRRQASDAGVPNWTVYIDANNNGVHDPTEVFARTTGSGFYVFRDLVPGTYRLRIQASAADGLVPLGPTVRLATATPSARPQGGNHFGLTPE